MSDPALLARFEADAIEPRDFGHEDHLRLAWILLAEEQLAFADAYVRLRRGLSRLAARAGRPERYHETRTLGWLALVHEAVQAGPAASYEAFMEKAGHGLDRGALDRLYEDGRLASDAARTGLILPVSTRL